MSLNRLESLDNIDGRPGIPCGYRRINNFEQPENIEDNSQRITSFITPKGASKLIGMLGGRSKPNVCRKINFDMPEIDVDEGEREAAIALLQLAGSSQELSFITFQPKKDRQDLEAAQILIELAAGWRKLQFEESHKISDLLVNGPPRQITKRR